MKKNLVLFAALMLTVVFGSAEIAKAADVQVGGQIFTRYEMNEHGSPTGISDFDDKTDATDFIGQRTAVDVKANINDETSVFIQLMSNRQWGSGFVGNTTSGARDGSFNVNDSDESVGVHEAYFTLKNFAGLPVDAKVGKQEIIMDGHRIFGDTLWTMGQNSHDAVRLTHKHGNATYNAAWMRANQQAVSTDDANTNNDNINAYMAHANYKGILGGQLSLVYALISDPCGNVSRGDSANDCTDVRADNDIHTIGFRQAGQLFGIDYRGEYYYQWGDANDDADDMEDGTKRTTTYIATGEGVDRDAFMFGVRVGKQFNNVAMKPSLTFWYDYLSGTSDNDLAGDNPTFSSFNTVFDTGHKFYGLQDLFLGVGNGAATNGTAGMGLVDMAVKAKLSPMPGWTVKADYHWFSTAESVDGSPGAGMAGGSTRGNDNLLGNELDITLVNKYNANTKVMIGFSNFQTTAAFRDLRNLSVGDDANWAYVQFDIQF
jgi:hypothetical protein